jgi:peptidoglycan hydrolase CwlO-like protein
LPIENAKHFKTDRLYKRIFAQKSPCLTKFSSRQLLETGFWKSPKKIIKQILEEKMKKLKLTAIILTIAMVLSITATASTTQRLNGDVDNDGSVTISDALEILKYLAGLPNELDIEKYITVCNDPAAHTHVCPACIVCPGNDALINNLNNDITSNAAEINSLKLEVFTLEGIIEGLRAGTGDTNQIIADLNSKISELEIEVDRLTGWVCPTCNEGAPATCAGCTTAGNTITERDSTIAGLRTDIGDLQTQVTQLTSSNGALQIRINELEAGLTPTQCTLCPGLTQERDNIRTERDNLQTQVGTLTTERDGFRTERDTLRTQANNCPISCNVNHVCGTGSGNHLGRNSGALPAGTSVNLDNASSINTAAVFWQPANQVEGRPQNRLRIEQGGTYILSGTLTGAHLSIGVPTENANRDVTIILNNAHITNTNGPAIYVRRAGTVNIIIQDGTVNTLSDGDTTRSYVLYRNDPDGVEPNGTVFSSVDLNIWGHGSLTVRGNFRHGISTRDDLNIQGGRITVITNIGNTTEGNALLGRDSVSISGGIFDLRAGNHGIRSNNISGSQNRDRPENSDKFNVRHDSGFVNISGGQFTINALNGCAIRSVVPVSPRTAGGTRITGGEMLSILARVGGGSDDD